MGQIVERVDAESRRFGKVIPLADLQIGATALHFGFELGTVNVRHFRMIPKLVVNPL